MGGAQSREDLRGRPIRILCAGDSITEGCSAFQPQTHPYSALLAAAISAPTAVDNVGQAGLTVAQIHDRLRDALKVDDTGKRLPYDVVLVMGGTNDIGPDDSDLEALLGRLEAAWRTARQSGAVVAAMTVVEVRLGVPMRDRALALNEMIRARVAELQDDGIRLLDAFAALPSDGHDAYWSDPVHPSARGYKRLGEYVGDWLEASFDWHAIRRRTMFRPCIDIHSGVVKQIVGGTLSDDAARDAELRTNYVAEHPASWFADVYKKHNLTGGHVIKLGPNCDDAARSALAAWPGFLQVGGGVTNRNAKDWIDAGASMVIVTSWLFPEGEFAEERLEMLRELVGRERIVVDLSCRRTATGWTVAMNKWQTLTTLDVTHANLDRLAGYCAEFLVHAADVEGLQQGVDTELVSYLGDWAAQRAELLGGGDFGVTYAGGARSVADLKLVHELSGGFVDLTIGSALDIFGGSGATLEECIEWNRGYVRS